ncbi:hypothetical protein VNO80_32040 [Phaseolus coccineus]|uniref:Senescence-associated protein n=1 Tax=Phaseolus coccineus TaxID=3886 RepID=A0AAN9L2H7_PHACN
MIGRADIEGSKSNESTSFYPFVPHEISVLVELILGHLRYLLTDVPPSPNSPPDNVFRPGSTGRSRPWVQKEGAAPRLRFNGISKITLKVVVFHFRCFQLPLILHLSSSFHKVGLESSSTGSSFPADSAKPVPLAVVSLDSRQGQWESLDCSDARGRGPKGPVPNPSPDRHATDPLSPREQLEQSTDSRRVRDWDPVPSPQSQSFSRGYGSILPTSLAYIVPSTRGCSPWRPDAVMSTTGRGRPSVLRIFKGRRGRTDTTQTCGALPAAGPYLRLSRFQGGQAICTDDRSARAHALGFTATAAPSYSSGLGPCPDGRVSAQLGTVTQLPGSSRIASSAYQKWPTWSSRFRGTLNRAAVPSLPI